MTRTAEKRIDFTNSVVLAGRVCVAAELSHEFCGQRFFTMMISVPRLSGAVDILPLTVSEILSPLTIEEGSRILADGQLRSYRRFDGERNRLCLSVFCKSLQLVFDENCTSNAVSISGQLLKQPVIRRTPLGRDICDLLVSVPRAFSKSDVVPVIAWGINAAAAAEFVLGQEILISGRFQSREYQKKLEDGEAMQRTAYELSATELMPVVTGGT